jgi:hypothetical protein
VSAEKDQSMPVVRATIVTPEAQSDSPDTITTATQGAGSTKHAIPPGNISDDVVEISSSASDVRFFRTKRRSVKSRLRPRKQYGEQETVSREGILRQRERDTDRGVVGLNWRCCCILQ